MNSYAQGQSERLPQMFADAEEQEDAQMDEAAAAHAASARRTLRAEWKDGYQAKVETARTVAANVFRGDEFEQLTGIRLADGSLLGDNPVLIKALAKMGSHMALESSAELAQQDLAELETDADFNRKYYDTSDTPEHRMAVEKHERLYQRAYPEKAPTQVEPVTAEAKAAAKAELKRYADIKGLGAELSKAMGNMDAPSDRSDKDRQILARWKELNRIAEAPLASPGGDWSFAGQPAGESANQATRAKALAEIKKIEKNPDFWDEDVSRSKLEVHRALVARRDALYKIVY